MEIHGWGRYPSIQADTVFPRNQRELTENVAAFESLIARGFGRSYGDSSLAHHVLSTRNLNRFIGFDPPTGNLTCSAGVSLADILEIFVPRGWFLPVTPGTRYVSVGGAIASDVHGKNHHLDGTFCQHINEIQLLLGNGEQIAASPRQNSDLFYATCGGMGLTGIILSATIQLRPIYSSQILETTIKIENLNAVLDALDSHSEATYSVAWIDCLAKGKDLGRSLLMLGEHAEVGGFRIANSKPISIPISMPGCALNRMTIRTFNALYYRRVRQLQQKRLVHYEPFFYPLDRITNWNRLYGKAGFTQYQFVLPKESGRQGMMSILSKIAVSGMGSFLAVLKAFGEGNSNYLSFPMKGYTLALDFKAEPAVFKLLSELDRLVLDFGGRIYLTKDARMTEETFKASYVNWQDFQEVRERYHALGKFSSLQSERLGLK